MPKVSLQRIGTVCVCCWTTRWKLFVSLPWCLLWLHFTNAKIIQTTFLSASLVTGVILFNYYLTIDCDEWCVLRCTEGQRGCTATYADKWQSTCGWLRELHRGTILYRSEWTCTHTFTFTNHLTAYCISVTAPSTAASYFCAPLTQQLAT